MTTTLAMRITAEGEATIFPRLADAKAAIAAAAKPDGYSQFMGFTEDGMQLRAVLAPAGRGWLVKARGILTHAEYGYL